MRARLLKVHSSILGGSQVSIETIRRRKEARTREHGQNKMPEYENIDCRNRWKLIWLCVCVRFASFHVSFPFQYSSHLFMHFIMRQT